MHSYINILMNSILKNGACHPGIGEEGNRRWSARGQEAGSASGTAAELRVTAVKR